jgi:hypothetical protein
MWPASLLVLLGSVPALAGVIVGNRLERHGEHEAWLRQARLEAYAALLVALHEAWEYMADHVYGSQSEDETLGHLWGQMKERLARVGVADSKVHLLGPGDVATTGHAAMEKLYAIGGSLSSVQLLFAAQRTSRTLGETAGGRAFIAAEIEFVKVASNALQ